MRFRLTLLFAVISTISTALFAQEEFNPELPPEPSVMYKVNVVSDPDGTGSVSTSGSFTAGTEIYMNCSANESYYRFVKWTLNGADYSTEMSFLYIVPASESNFVAHYTDVRDISAKLYVESDPIEVGSFNTISGEMVEQGESVTLYAYPNTDAFNFVGWYDGETKLTSEMQYIFTMPTPSVETTLTAKWEFDPIIPQDPEIVTFYDITTSVDPENGGIVIGGGTYQEGRTAYLSAVPANDGWVFERWNDGETMQYRSVPVTGNVSYTAMFRSIAATSKTLSFSSNLKDACSFNRASGELVSIGESVILTAYSNSDFVFKGWYNGSDLVCEDLSYTFVMPSKDYTLEARFEFVPQLPEEPDLTDKEAPEISVDGTVITGSATYYTDVTLTITDDVGVTSVTINEVEKESPYKIPAENGDYVVVAKDAAGNSTQVVIKIEISGDDGDDGPGIKPVPEPFDPSAVEISTTVFRTVDGFGIEMISKEAVVAKIFDEQGAEVKSEGVQRYQKIALEPGSYTMDVFAGEKKLFSKIPFKVGKK